MQIKINGQPTTIDDSVADVSALLSHLDVDTDQIALEKNFEIIPKSQYSQTAVTSGDEIELVEFVGGG